MKKSILFLSLIGMLAACSNDNVPAEGDHSLTGGKDEVKGYLTLNLVAPGGGYFTTGTRATYQDGTPSESYVSLVRFYFFDTDGYPVPVRKNPDQEPDEGDVEYFSYYDWTPTPEQNSEDTSNPENTVEKTLTFTMTLSGPEDQSLPDAMTLLAVVNPPQNMQGMTSATLPELRGLIDDYVTNLTDNNFVMSNSVFINKEGELVEAIPIPTECIAFTATAAQENPLVVFVERVAARLDFGLEAISQNDLYDIDITYKPIDPSGVSDDTYQGEVYLKLNGWTVTSTPNISNLVKNINSNWPDNLFGNTEPWNSSDFNRSFWAINPQSLSENPLEDMSWFSYNEINSSGLQLPVYGESSVSTYIQENANPYETASESASQGANPKYPTKVIIAGTLCDADGNAITIAEYNQEYYTVEGLTSYIANYLNMWTQENGSYVKVQPSDLQLITAAKWIERNDPDGFNAPDVSGTYFVYFVLTPEAEQKTWVHQTETTGNYTNISNPDMFIFDSVGRAMVWNEGMTYYYFDVLHLGAEGSVGYHGVVRNHIYDTTVSAFLGLGTPVYDPDETIYPEKPTRYGNMISAQINVLQWRLVKQNFELAW